MNEDVHCVLEMEPGRARSDSVASRSSSAPESGRASLFAISPSTLHLGGESFIERRPLLTATLRVILLFLFAILTTALLLKLSLPPITDEDWALIKLPKSFQDLKELNLVLQRLKDQHYYQTIISFSIVYLFLQSFSIPGSMYLSILAGALYGVLIALPLVCFLVATGALLCYFISSLLGPAFLANDKWHVRLENWRARVDAQGDNLFSYLIVLRIAPLPPHWVVNLIAPHLGISIPKFFFSTFIGISGVTYIHTSIGTALDQMTSSDDFHLISWANFGVLAGICVAVLVPTLIRRKWSKELSSAAESDDAPLYSDATTPESHGSPASSATFVADDTELQSAVPFESSHLAKHIQPFSIDQSSPLSKTSPPLSIAEDDDEEIEQKDARHPSTKASKIFGVSAHDLPRR